MGWEIIPAELYKASDTFLRAVESCCFHVCFRNVVRFSTSPDSELLTCPWLPSCCSSIWYKQRYPRHAMYIKRGCTVFAPREIPLLSCDIIRYLKKIYEI